MTHHRSLFLASALLSAGGCPSPAPMDVQDFRTAPSDFATPPDQRMSVEPDLSSPADMALVCPDTYRQTYDAVQMKCACDTAKGATVACSATFCCSTGQSCLDNDRCSPPTGRRLHAMAYDGKLNRALVFGGDTFDTASMTVKRLGDLWQLDAVTWGPVELGATKPSPRFAPAMAFDGTRMVLFGGSTLNAMNQERMSAETWLLDGSTLTLAAGTAPTARSGHSMIYDSSRGRVVMFGGLSDTALLNDTWEWNGTAWLQKTISGTVPAPRENAQMAYDAKRGFGVMFGGTIGVFNYSNETWIYNGAVNTWLKATTATTPKARSLGGMAYDANRERVVMFSGEVPGSAGEPDLWEWDGAVWKQIPLVNGPLPRIGPAMVYDPVRKVVLVFGGTTGVAGTSVWARDMWSWDGAVWKQLY